jgi:hypothetical protein
MAPFDFDPLENYEIDRWPFDEALRLHRKLMETSRLGWLVFPGYDSPKIVVSEPRAGGLAVYNAGTLAERMRSGLQELQVFRDEMFEKLSCVQGAEREQVERAIVMICRLLDIWCKSLCICIASQERITEASRSVVKRLRIAVVELDLCNPEVFGRLVHELTLKIRETIGICGESASQAHASAA